MEEMRNIYKILVGNMKGRNLEDVGVDGRIILEQIFTSALEGYGGKAWTGCIWLRTGTSGGLL
jgi:hypothetical protein